MGENNKFEPYLDNLSSSILVQDLKITNVEMYLYYFASLIYKLTRPTKNMRH